MGNVLLVLVPPLAITGWGTPDRWLDPRIPLLALLLGVAATTESWVATRVERGPVAGASARWLPLATGVVFLAVLWCAVATRVHGAPLVPWIPAPLGSLFFLVGVALRVQAIRTLGRWFSNEIRTVVGQPLHTEGVYAWLRHPSETGTLAQAWGVLVLLRSPTALGLFALVLLPLVWWRIRLEDRLLAELHGDAFQAYARRVPRLIPGL